MSGYLPNGQRSFIGAKFYQSGTVAITSQIAMPLNTSIIDTGFNGTPFHNNTNPSRLTIPNGVSVVRVHGQMGYSFTALAAVAYGATILFKNGATITPQTFSRDWLPLGATTSTSNASGIFPVVPGDYFEVCPLSTLTGLTTSAATCFLELEVLQ